MRRIATANRVLLIALGLGVLAATPCGQEAGSKAERPSWRDVKVGKKFLSLHESNGRYALSVRDLLQEFVRCTGLSVTQDERLLQHIPELAIAGDNVGEQRLFDLCQLALSAGSVSLFPVDAEATMFKVERSGLARELAPRAEIQDMENLAPTEWASISFSAAPASGRKLRLAINPLLSRDGGSAEILEDGALVVLVDRSANLRRILELVQPFLDGQPDLSLVNYQRSSDVDLRAVAETLAEFLRHWTESEGLDADLVYIEWDDFSRLLVGRVPAACAAFLDAVVDAAEERCAEAEKEKAEQDRNFVNFLVEAPQGADVLRLEGFLRVLFGPEIQRGDLRTVVKDKEANTLAVRCRDWLEEGVRDAVKQFSEE